MKKEYIKPKPINLSETINEDDIIRTTNSFCRATAEEISDIFSMGINPDTKKRFDYAELVTISLDLERYAEYLSTNPDKYISEKQLYTKSRGLTEEESDELRPNANEPRLFPATRMQTNIDEFILKTENTIGIETCIDDIKKIDGIYDCITLIKPRIRKRNGEYINNHDNIDNYGFSSLITNIRNGLMHNSYLVYGSNVYINNPKGGKDENGFEAVVSYGFFEHMYHLGRNGSRRPRLITLKTDNIKWGKGYEANKNKIETIITDTNKSTELMDTVNQVAYLMKNGIDRGRPLSAGKKELLKGFFEEYDFCEESLCHAILGMTKKSLGMDLWHYIMFGGEKQYLLDFRNYQLKCNSAPGLSGQLSFWQTLTKGDDINKRLIWNDERYLIDIIRNISEGLNATNKEILRVENYLVYMKSLLEAYRSILSVADFVKLDYLKILYISKFFINNPTLELARPQKRGPELKNQCINYIMNKCKNKPDAYRSKESKQSNLNKIFGCDYRLRIFKQFTQKQLSKDQIIQKALEDRRITLDQKGVLKNNITTVIEKWEKQLDEVIIIQEPEHIRNAFAHHNYTIIPGYGKILLEDPSRNDFPNRRKIYDLNELYEYCLCNTKEYFLGVK